MCILGYDVKCIFYHEGGSKKKSYKSHFSRELKNVLYRILEAQKSLGNKLFHLFTISNTYSISKSTCLFFLTSFFAHTFDCRPTIIFHTLFTHSGLTFCGVHLGINIPLDEKEHTIG